MNILDNFKKPLFYRQHPEAALRYLPVVDLLRKEHLENSRILEVGSGSLGIAPYLGKPVTGVDTAFNEPEFPLLKQVHASGEKLPFTDNQFDVVILSDVLEHIPKDQRAKVLHEAIRVAKKAVVLSGPFGEKAASQDRELAAYSLKKSGKLHPYFKDHLELGLPGVESITEEIKTNNKVDEVKVVGSYLNLAVRKQLMKLFITNNKLMFYFYLKGLMPLVPLLRLMNKKPYYRRLLLVTLR